MSGVPICSFPNEVSLFLCFPPWPVFHTQLMVYFCVLLLWYATSAVLALSCSTTRRVSVHQLLHRSFYACAIGPQLPHIGEAEAKTISTSKPPVKGIAQYIKLPREERKVRKTERERDSVVRCPGAMPFRSAQALPSIFGSRSIMSSTAAPRGCSGLARRGPTTREFVA